MILRSLLLVLAFTSAAFASTTEVIQKARAYLGGDAALDQIKSIHLKGKMEILPTEDKADTKAPPPVDIEVIFQKDYQQRIEVVTPEKTETTALNDYEGWQQEVATDTGNRKRLTVLGPSQVKRLRANTWENIAFFKDIESIGGHVEDLGHVTVDGIDCDKLSFVHSDGIVFNRCFDAKTGRLVETETDSGTLIREEGEIKVDGVRFSRKVFNTNKLPDGTKQTMVITFDTVTLNEKFPDSQFSVPLAKQ